MDSGLFGDAYTGGQPRGAAPSGAARVKVKAFNTAGVGGAIAFGGFIASQERDAQLWGRRRYQTYSEILSNIAVVSLGVRYALDLISKPEWDVEPADDSPEAADAAEFVETVFEDLATPWNRIVRRAAMFRFYGFSIHEWTALRRDDGRVGLLDVEVRPQATIERWDLDEFGTVHGVIQRSPQTGAALYIPRGKIIHLVDDSTADTPEGVGLFRHCVETAKRLQRYRQLEGFGFETDLRGVPIGRAPVAEIQSLVAGGMKSSDADALLSPMNEFMSAHIKSPDAGILLDSAPYTDQGANRSPSGTRKWDMELMQGGASGLDSVGRAIDRETLWLAALFGVEHILIGASNRGSQALSRDKSTNFALQCDSTLAEIVRSTETDLLAPLFVLNGIEAKLIPSLVVEKIQWRDVEQVTGALEQMARAGAPLVPDDPAVPQIRGLLGLKKPPAQSMIDPGLMIRGRRYDVGVQSGVAADRTTPPAPKQVRSETNGAPAKN